jgi:hypothetical protein
MLSEVVIANRQVGLVQVVHFFAVCVGVLLDAPVRVVRKQISQHRRSPPVSSSLLILESHVVLESNLLHGCLIISVRDNHSSVRFQVSSVVPRIDQDSGVSCLLSENIPENDLGTESPPLESHS